MSSKISHNQMRMPRNRSTNQEEEEMIADLSREDAWRRNLVKIGLPAPSLYIEESSMYLEQDLHTSCEDLHEDLNDFEVHFEVMDWI